MPERSITSAENTWLLRIITAMASFISVMVMVMFNMFMSKFDKLEDTVAELKLSDKEQNVWIKTYDNSQKRTERNIDHIWEIIGGNKLYALKPEDVKIKSENLE